MLWFITCISWWGRHMRTWESVLNKKSFDCPHFFVSKLSSFISSDWFRRRHRYWVEGIFWNACDMCVTRVTKWRHTKTLGCFQNHLFVFFRKKSKKGSHTYQVLQTMSTTDKNIRVLFSSRKFSQFFSLWFIYFIEPYLNNFDA